MLRRIFIAALIALPIFAQTYTETSSGQFTGSGIGVGGLVGSTVASASSITITEFVTSISGSASIATINGMTSGRMYIVVPAAGATWKMVTGGNIAQNLTPNVGDAIVLVKHGTTVRALGYGLASLMTLGTGTSLVDGSSWPLTRELRTNYATVATGNEFVSNTQLNITGDSGAVSNYEKAATISYCKTSDPSGAVTRDCVGLDTRGMIAAGLTTGRTWGLYSEAQIISTGDGLAQNEIGVRNNGADAATPDFSITGKNKIALQLFSVGSFPATIGLNFAGTGTFHKGIYFLQSALANAANDSAVEINTGAAVVYKLTRDGTVSTGREISFGTAPGITGAGAGATATYVASTGSTDRAGEIIITANGAGIAAAGSVTITYTSALGTNGSSCMGMLRNGSGPWQTGSTLIGGAMTTAVGTLNWDNHTIAGVATVLTGGSTYAVEYRCIGR